MKETTGRLYMTSKKKLRIYMIILIRHMVFIIYGMMT
nr:MAG TPA: hypothetical protein [Caudoviricetes sp.]